MSAPYFSGMATKNSSRVEQPSMIPSRRSRRRKTRLTVGETEVFMATAATGAHADPGVHGAAATAGATTSERRP